MQTYVIPYAFNTASPLQIVLLLSPGEYVMRAEVEVAVVFTDPVATLELGVPGTPGAILDAASIDPLIAGFYRQLDPFTVGVAAPVELTITPGASAAGSGTVFVEVWVP